MAREHDLNRDLLIEEKLVQVTGEVVLRKYSKGRFLGKGGFARVYELTDLATNRLIAAKIVPKASLEKSRTKRKLMTEIKIHKSLSHAQVLGFEHFFEDSENVYILLELCSSQTLNDLLKRRKRLTELEVQCYVLQLAEGIRYLQSQQVIHRDLKLGNLFLTEKMELKIGDFGLATTLESCEKKRTICGTPNYIAPEVLEGKQGHSFAVDIWALGVIIYALIVGKPPFETCDVKTTYRRIKTNSYSFPSGTSISEPAKSLISRILVTDPYKRPSLDEILDHEFFKQDVPKLLPTSTLACPPSSSYLRQFQAHRSEPAALLKPMSPRQPVASSNENCDRSGVWVMKWVDYSSKYGVGYLLSNGSNGVLFNDSSKIILSPSGHIFNYIESRTQDVVTGYSLTNYPKQLHKKVTLLQHFRSYLQNEAQNTTEEDLTAPPVRVYLKKWLRTKHAILFRLSNKLVQVNFTDKTEIAISSETRLVSYFDKKGQRSTYRLSSALESSNSEMTKRLKYAKDVLTLLLSNLHKRPSPTN